MEGRRACAVDEKAEAARAADEEAKDAYSANKEEKAAVAEKTEATCVADNGTGGRRRRRRRGRHRDRHGPIATVYPPKCEKSRHLCARGKANLSLVVDVPL